MVFHAVASGAGTLRYQWLRNGVAIDGEVGNRLEVTVAASGVSDRFSVQVADANGSATSEGLSYRVVPADRWTWWETAPAGPVASTPVDGLSEFANGGMASTFDLFALGADARRLANQGTWSPVTLLQDPVSGTPRLLIHAAGGRLRITDLRVEGDAVASTRVLSSAPTRTLCTDPEVYEDRADILRSWLVFLRAGADGSCRTADDDRLAIRLNQPGTEIGVVVPRVLQAAYRANGSLAGLVAAEASGGVSLLQGWQLNATPAFVPTSGLGATLVAPSPSQTRWVFNDGVRIRSVDVSAPLPWTPVTLAEASALDPSATPLQSFGLVSIEGVPSLLFRTAPGSPLKVCALVGCPAGARDVVGAFPNARFVERIRSTTDPSLAWFYMSDFGADTGLLSLELDGTFTQRVRLDANGLAVRAPSNMQIVGPWLVSKSVSGTWFALPTNGPGGDRAIVTSDVVGHWPNEAAARADRFWFIRGSGSERGMKLVDATGTDLANPRMQLIADSFLRYDNTKDQELLVVEWAPGATGPGGASVLGLDPVSGAVRTRYGELPANTQSLSREGAMVAGRDVLILTTHGSPLLSRTDVHRLTVGAAGLTTLVRTPR